MATKDELEKRALKDYRDIRGMPIWVSEIYGFVESNGVGLELDQPALVKVTETDQEGLIHWVYGWLDPYWNVELLRPHPELEGVRSLWMYGTSYSLEGKKSQRARHTLARIQDPTPAAQDLIVIERQPALLVDHRGKRVGCIASVRQRQYKTEVFELGSPNSVEVRGKKETVGRIHFTDPLIGPPYTFSDEYPFDLFFIFQEGEPPRKVEACWISSPPPSEIHFMAGRITDL
jgi:hypothetical protein